MTASYDANLGDNVSKVRLIIGDTDVSPASDAVFTDEELTYFISAGGSVNLGAAMALEAWAAKYSASPDSEKIGDYTYTQKIVDKMLNMAARLRETDAETPAFEWAEIDLSGGSGITAEED